MNNDLVMSILKMAMENNDSSKAAVDQIVDKGRYIVIGNRGNVVVGDLTIKGGTGYMENASVIRRWGTTDGPGQLALEGAQSGTILDKCGEFEFEKLTTCGMIPVVSDL